MNSIKYVVQTFASLRDVNGNCYYYGRLTSVKSGKSLWVSTHCDSNLYHYLVKAVEGLRGVPEHQGYNYIHQAETCWDKKREWARRKSHIEPSLEDKDITPKVLRALDRGGD